MSGLIVTDLNLIRDNNYILKEINFDIPKNSVNAIVGLQHSGKGELINLIAGIDKPSDGQVYFDDISCQDRFKGDKRVCAVVFTQTSIYTRFTIYENLLFFANLTGLNSKKSKEIVANIMRDLDIWSNRDLPAFKLTSVQLLKTKIAIALLQEPELLILQDIEKDIDKNVFTQICEYILKIKEKRGLTIIFTSHTGFCLDFCDKIFVLHRGRIIARGNTKQLMTAAQVKLKASVRVQGEFEENDFDENEDGTFQKEINSESDMIGIIKNMVDSDVKLMEAKIITPSLNRIVSKLYAQENDDE